MRRKKRVCFWHVQWRWRGTGEKNGNAERNWNHSPLVSPLKRIHCDSTGMSNLAKNSMESSASGGSSCGAAATHCRQTNNMLLYSCWKWRDLLVESLRMFFNTWPNCDCDWDLANLSRYKTKHEWTKSCVATGVAYIIRFKDWSIIQLVFKMQLFKCLWMSLVLMFPRPAEYLANFPAAPKPIFDASPTQLLLLGEASGVIGIDLGESSSGSGIRKS